MTIKSGFVQTIQGLTIEKDTEAVLFYTFNWAEWLPNGDSLASTQYTIAARSNDPDPLEIESQGVSAATTFVELSNGQEGKTYTVTCRITTTNGLIDRRNFRVRILARSA